MSKDSTMEITHLPFASRREADVAGGARAEHRETLLKTLW
jgi:hypothetical protein